MRGCGSVATAAYVAFAKTPADRKPSDLWLSIAERYKDRADYLNRIRVATRKLIEQRFLLQEDGVIIIHAATQSSAFDYRAWLLTACPEWVIHVIPAIPARPVRPKSGHSANARVYECAP